MSWRIELGKSDLDTRIFYNDQQVGYIQGFQLNCSAGGGIPELTLKIINPDLKVEGTLDSAKVKIEKVQKCPQCGEEERITNKGW